VHSYIIQNLAAVANEGGNYMNARTKRAFSALITVSVLAVTVFGIVALAPVPVSAVTKMVPQGPTTGRVGEKLEFGVQVTDCGPPADFNDPNPPCEPLNNFWVTFNFREGADVIGTLDAATNEQGYATVSFAFDHSGSYGVFVGANLAYEIWSAPATPLYVTIKTEATPTPTLATPTTPTLTTPTTPTLSTPTPTVGGGQLLGALPSTPGVGIAVVLLAIGATALLMRRRGEDDNEGKESCRREKRYRR